MKNLLIVLGLILCFVVSAEAQGSAVDRVVAGNLDMTSTLSKLEVSCDSKASVSGISNYTSQTGSIRFEGSADGVTYQTLYPLRTDSSNGAAGSQTCYSDTAGNIVASGTNLSCVVGCAGWRSIRVRVSVGGAGSLGYTLFSSNAPFPQERGTIPGTTGISLGKAEDAAHTSGDVGVMALTQRNTSFATLTSNDGDYSAIATAATGAIFCALDTQAYGGTGSPMANEDSAIADTKALMMAGAITQDPITSDQNANNDAAHLKVTRGGKLQVAFAPATEYWKSCGTATAVTSDVAIKASVASNKIYVSSISCKNSSTTQNTNLDFKDGTTTFAEGAIGAFVTGTSQPGTYTTHFPVPAQLTSATAFNFATNTATSSVTCCANGYISVD